MIIDCQQLYHCYWNMFFPLLCDIYNTEYIDSGYPPFHSVSPTRPLPSTFNLSALVLIILRARPLDLDTSCTWLPVSKLL